MSNTKLKDNPVVKVAKKNSARKNEDGIVILSTGVRAKITPVSGSLIEEVTSRFKPPKVPMWLNPDKEREEPNPNDPEYQEALREATRAQAVAANDTLVMLGVELVDPLPEDDIWIKKLKFLGIEVDADDPFQVEFAYKKYVACAAIDLIEIGRRTGINEEAIAEAVAAFQGGERRATDNGSVD